MDNKRHFNRACSMHMKSIKKEASSKKGLTLIELIVVVAVISVIIVPVAGTFTAGYKAFYKEDENVNVTRCARIAMERVVDEIRKAPPNDIKYSSENSIKIKGSTIDEGYAFGGTDEEDVLNKELGIKVYLDDGSTLTGQVPAGKAIGRVEVTVKVKGMRTGQYEISTCVYMRND